MGEWGSEHYKVSVLSDRLCLFFISEKQKTHLLLGLIIEHIFSCTVVKGY